MISVDEIVASVKQVGIPGLLEVRTPPGAHTIALVDFWRLGGAFRNDRERKITMVIDPQREGFENELLFYVPPLETCKINDLALTIYMDANLRARYGGHRWNLEGGEVVFSYSMPIPPDVEGFPDVALFERLLRDMYESLLYREFVEIKQRISHDDLLNDQEKEEKTERVVEMYTRLTRSVQSHDEGV